MCTLPCSINPWPYVTARPAEQLLSRVGPQALPPFVGVLRKTRRNGEAPRGAATRRCADVVSPVAMATAASVLLDGRMGGALTVLVLGVPWSGRRVGRAMLAGVAAGAAGVGGADCALVCFACVSCAWRCWRCCRSCQGGIVLGTSSTVVFSNDSVGTVIFDSSLLSALCFFRGR